MKPTARAVSRTWPTLGSMCWPYSTGGPQGKELMTVTGKANHTRRRRTYIAGPMRGYQKLNFEAFYDAEDSLRRLGWDCLNPARMDMEANPSVSDPDKLPLRPMSWYVERDVAALCTLDPGNDAVHFLPDWHKSRGARAEHAVAEWLGLERIYL